ncbi:aldo/keto reductase [uncultured Megasphaera sp.]|uniref:aldo/keto reductase n=1 Tax=uncultured Megasphaera sp. TaxID=165188 RepID=UPI00261BA56A|nr:aldo/keto reductase [uncultured Megasphaera sp.]
MHKHIILNNGLTMPAVGFGTWMLKGEAGKQAIREALSVGYRLIDTAHMYDNEAIVGQAVAESGLRREDIFITTKLCQTRAGYELAWQGIEESLARLQTDYIDLMLIHEPYDEALDMYRALTEAYRRGIVRAIGISNFNAREYLDFIGSCNITPMINQVECHVYYRRKELQRALVAQGTQMQAWSPFTERKKPIFQEPILQAVGQKYSKTAAQVALLYLVQQGIGVIPKSSHRERMIENLDIFDATLTLDDMARIQQLETGKTLFGWYED